VKVFLDANVVFSASKEGSHLNRLISLLQERSFTLITSDFAREEAVRNLRTKRPAWETGFNDLMTRIAVVPSIDRPLSVNLVPKDRPILATAITHGCDYLITGDKQDFGHLFGTSSGGVTILTPLSLAEMLGSTAWPE
jgi:predicted nucleic acid-binding protein